MSEKTYFCRNVPSRAAFLRYDVRDAFIFTWKHFRPEHWPVGYKSSKFPCRVAEQIASLLYAAIAPLVKPGATFNSLIYRKKTLFSPEERSFSVNSWERSHGAVVESGLDWRTLESNYALYCNTERETTRIGLSRI